MTQLLMSQEEINENRKKWMELRRGGVTASEIAPISGIARQHGSAYSYYRAKITGEEFDGDSDATLRGTHLEPYVVDRYAREYETGPLRMGGLYASSQYPWAMATPDRFAFLAKQWPKAQVPVQIKTSATYEGWGDPGSDDIPVPYYAQCLWEMFVMESDAIEIPCLFVHTWLLRVFRINRTVQVEKQIAMLRQAGEDFMEHLRNQVEPEIDWSTATTKALKTQYQAEPGGTVVIPLGLARRYKAAQRATAQAERMLGQASNEIMARAGDAKYIITPPDARNPNEQAAPVAQRIVYPKKVYDDKALREKHPRLAKQHRKPDITIVQMRAGKWAAKPKKETRLDG